jgi:hypothetical protein
MITNRSSASPGFAVAVSLRSNTGNNTITANNPTMIPIRFTGISLFDQ